MEFFLPIWMMNRQPTCCFVWMKTVGEIHLFFYNSEQHCCCYSCVSRPTGFYTIYVALLFQLPVCYLDGILSLSVASMPEAMPKECRPIQAMQLKFTPTVLTRLQAGCEMRSIMLRSQLASFRLGKYDRYATAVSGYCYSIYCRMYVSLLQI